MLLIPLRGLTFSPGGAELICVKIFEGAEPVAPADLHVMALV